VGGGGGGGYRPAVDFNTGAPAAPVAAGLGRTAVSETEAPILTANLVYSG
jgi:hypothetical protein